MFTIPWRSVIMIKTKNKQNQILVAWNRVEYLLNYEFNRELACKVQVVDAHCDQVCREILFTVGWIIFFFSVVLFVLCGHFTAIKVIELKTTSITEKKQILDQLTIPDITILGSKKCGTKALLTFLLEHPKIRRCRQEFHWHDSSRVWHKVTGNSTIYSMSCELFS